MHKHWYNKYTLKYKCYRLVVMDADSSSSSLKARMQSTLETFFVKGILNEAQVNELSGMMERDDPVSEVIQKLYPVWLSDPSEAADADAPYILFSDNKALNSYFIKAQTTYFMPRGISTCFRFDCGRNTGISQLHTRFVVKNSGNQGLDMYFV